MRSGLKNYANIKIDNGNAVEKEELLSYFGKLKGNPELSKIVSIRFLFLIYLKIWMGNRSFKPAFKDFKRKYINEIVSSFNSRSISCLEKSFLYVKNSTSEHEQTQLDESYFVISF